LPHRTRPGMIPAVLPFVHPDTGPSRVPPPRRPRLTRVTSGDAWVDARATWGAPSRRTRRSRFHPEGRPSVRFARDTRADAHLAMLADSPGLSWRFMHAGLRGAVRRPSAHPGNLGSQKLPPPTFHDVAVRGAGRGERFLAPPLADSGSPLRPGAASLSLEGTSGEPRVVTLGRRLPSVPSPSPGQASVKGSLSGGFTHLTESRWCFKEQFRCYLGRPARPVRLASALASPPQPPLADPRTSDLSAFACHNDRFLRFHTFVWRLVAQD
jgi:hypothetical protein